MAIRLSRTFVLRKLHQLTGIVPLGAFLLEHFYTNSKAGHPTAGPEHFNKAVADLQSIPFIFGIEVALIFVPLLYHAVYGLVITAEAKPNTLHYKYSRNWWYTLQRTTGIILFFFILYHLLNFRFGFAIFPGMNTEAVAHNADRAFQIVAREFSMWWVVALYVVGIASTVWHFANGLFLFAVDWGIVIGDRAQKMTWYASMAFGALLFIVGINALVAFIRPGGFLGGLF